VAGSLESHLQINLGLDYAASKLYLKSLGIRTQPVDWLAGWLAGQRIKSRTRLKIAHEIINFSAAVSVETGIAKSYLCHFINRLAALKLEPAWGERYIYAIVSRSQAAPHFNKNQSGKFIEHQSPGGQLFNTPLSKEVEGVRLPRPTPVTA